MQVPEQRVPLTTPHPTPNQECKYQNSEYRLSVFGVERDEWDRPYPYPYPEWDRPYPYPYPYP